jgi:hypothetical protein
MKLLIALVFMFFVHWNKWKHLFFDIFGKEGFPNLKKAGRSCFLPLAS